MRKFTRHGGFSLLEVLVALSIFAVIGLGANQLLRTVIDSNQAVKRSNAQTGRTMTAMALIERDLRQIVPRISRDEYGDSLPPIVVGDDTDLLTFTRTGWSNPLNRPRSSLQRVMYRWEENRLERHFWLVLDLAEDSEPQRQVLMEGVDSVSFNLIPKEDEDELSLQLEPQMDRLPAAVEIILTLEGRGDIRRIFPLVTALTMLDSSGPDNGSGDGSQGDPPIDNTRSSDGQNGGAP